MANEIDRLLAGLAEIRAIKGCVGPDHPQVKAWLVDARSCLRRMGADTELRGIAKLRFARSDTAMWRGEEPSQAELREFRSELEKARNLLETLRNQAPSESRSSTGSADPSPTSPTEEKGPAAAGKDAEKATEGLDESKPTDEIGPLPAKQEGEIMEKKLAPSFDAVTKISFSSSVRNQTIERLMADLESEMKSTSPDWEKVERLMGEMLGFKKAEELLERLRDEVNKSGAKWEAVRDIMAQLWACKKALLIDLLPTLLEV